MSISRTIKRNMIKKVAGTNKISNIWREIQIKRYTKVEWLKMFKACVSKLLNI